MPTNRRTRTSRLEYNEYLKSDHWKELRRLVLSEKPNCERCKNRPSTQVHHLRYKNLVDITATDLVSLCSDCHTRIHMAINFNLLPFGLNRTPYLELSNEQMDLILASKRKRVVLDDSLLERINQADLKIQRRICGVIAIKHPGDFLKLSGIKTTTKRFKYIEWLLRKNEFTNRVRPLGRKARRKAKDARKLARLLANQ